VSSLNVSQLKSASDDTVPSSNREPEAFTTVVIRHETLLEFGMIGKGARIINDDVLNDLTYRLHSNRGLARIIPPSSEITIQEWYSQIHIEPDAVTGLGQLELELATFKDAKKNGNR